MRGGGLVAVVAVVLQILLTGAAPATAAAPDEGFAVAAGRAYTIGTWYRSGSAVQAVASTYSRGGGWRRWFTGSPYGPSDAWARLETTTPVVPWGTERLRVDFPAPAQRQDVTLDDATAQLTPAAAWRAVHRPALDRWSGLVTNSYAFHNPRRGDAVRSSAWEVTTGSLFAVGGVGYTGRIDDGSPGPRSQVSTGSSVFRMNTRRADFGNVEVTFDLSVAAQTETARTPATGYDGVHIWLRHRSQFELYAASVTRRDGRVLIKKKCPGGPSNGGTYAVLGAEVPGGRIIRGRWRRVGATVQDNPSGSVTITVSVDSQPVVSAVDTGIGCAPITGPAAVGIRGDNTRFHFTNFTVRAL